MDIKRALNEVLFLKLPVDIVIRHLSNNSFGNLGSYSKLIKDSSRKQLTKVLPGYSDDEKDQIINYLDQIIKEDGHESIFNLIESFNSEVLVEYNCKPYCKYEKLMKWRMLSHKLEQDLLITSYLAKKDVISGRIRSNFTWEPIIKTDNIRLHNMLKQGMSENHFHLKGSAPHFNLTWISLMNRIVDRESEYKKTKIIENRLSPDSYFNNTYENHSLKEYVIKAAIIRMFLFTRLKGNSSNLGINISYKDLIDILSYNRELLSLNLDKFNFDISILRRKFGLGFDYNGNINYVDYAINKYEVKDEDNNYKLLLFGERKFMYDCFKEIYNPNNKEFKTYESLLHIYILIKAKLRAELVQTNDRIGFKNFSDYQDRKTVFLKKDPILKEAIYYMAMEASKEDQKILSIEARICNENTTVETVKEINAIEDILDKSKRNHCVYNEDRYKLYLERIKKETGNNKEVINRVKRENSEKQFYVIHIPKSRDYKWENSMKDKFKYLLLNERDFEQRIKAKDLANQIMKIREVKHKVSNLIRGIDACSNEIGCRPEIFGQAFRAIKYHTPYSENDNVRYGLNETKDIYPMKITYHVGEDFLDIVDGLRAIDEAIKFLNISHGDRIGHGLALGVDVEQWYKVKRNTVIISKHDYLDNLSWMLNKIRLNKITVEPFIKEELSKEFDNYFIDIYGMDNVSYMTYNDAWLLRGDNPKLYRSGKYEEPVRMRYWDRHSINNEIENLNFIRNNTKISNLYYRYHYDIKVRKEGSKIVTIKIKDYYLELIKKIQKSMQHEIRCIGIGIETNPSSNYLIGTFRRYDEHPILNFFNLGLTYDQNLINECPQLFVSINTDDQGIFGTYLENEYALMALALEKVKDSDGNQVYNTEMIYDWLNRIREMGIQQSFGYNIRR
ncbi:hypothetical protein [Paraclostridium bifermentans]|uniref:hypothetical protein n=1 Tax=Paraclostridium bifermentans TaxID=1490 RepID=UPI00374F1E02